MKVKINYKNKEVKAKVKKKNFPAEKHSFTSMSTFRLSFYIFGPMLQNFGAIIHYFNSSSMFVGRAGS
jgi:UDP-N-acetylglucosamine enolpyruvyl transferase